MEQLQSLAAWQIRNIWQHYNPENRSELSKTSTELRLMASHVVQRIKDLFFERMQSSSSRIISDKKLQQAFRKEQIYIFPGKCKNDKMTIRDMATHLYKKLSFNNSLTKETMVLKWSRFVEEIFVAGDTGSVAGCLVM